MNTPFDVLCCGFAVADFVFRVPRHPGPDEKIRADERTLCGGGPAANAAVQIARLGGKVAFLGRVGHDPLGDILRAEFDAEGVDTRWLRSDDNPTSIAALMVKPDGARAVVYHRPTHPKPLPEVDLRSAKVILVDNHEPEAALPLLVHARAAGVPTVLDAGTGSGQTRALAAEALHVVASAEFGRDVLGAEPTPQTISVLGGRDATVVVTRGAKGLLWSSPHGCGTQDAFTVPVVDTTGAGDAFHGAYAFALAKGLAFQEVLRFASAAGALACTRLGGRPSLATAQELARLLSSLRTEVA